MVEAFDDPDVENITFVTWSGQNRRDLGGLGLAGGYV